MKLLFVHQNLPGQFRHLIARYTAREDCRVIGLGERSRLAANRAALPDRVQLYCYDMPALPPPPFAWLRETEQGLARGRQVAQALQAMRRQGVIPDVIYAHPGWGEALYIKDVFPNTPLLCFGEFYYAAEGRDVGFDPEFPSGFESRLRVRTRNMQQLLSLEAADAIVCPTLWQRLCFPPSLQHKISVVHDGIDTTVVRPDPSARIALPRSDGAGGGLILGPEDEVITFVNRNLEPYRGFHSFMRALPELQAMRPNARVVIVGGDGVSYGHKPMQGTWREHMLAELKGKLDHSRIHFVGKLPYATYLNLLQVSSAHVYLTYPFVLGWSMLEAMAAGCAVVGSRTAPVTEVLYDDADGANGLLVDFFSPQQIAAAVNHACVARGRMRALREAARADVVRRFDLHSVCLPAQEALIIQMVEGRRASADRHGGLATGFSKGGWNTGVVC